MKPVAEARDAAVGMSRPVRGAWIETANIVNSVIASSLSRPVRGAWIETGVSSTWYLAEAVAPRAGRVD